MLAGADVLSLIPIRQHTAGEARRFYAETLGLRFIADDQFALVFEVNGRFLRLTKVDDFKPQPFSVIGWQVDDITDKAERLRAAGVVFERYPFLQQDELGIWAVPDGSAKIAWFKDPDGNVLSMVESPHDDATA